MENNFYYSFPAIKGTQASKEYYICMCPLKLVPKIFIFNEEELPPDFRSQRVINKNRIPEMTNYILSNPFDYVFSSLTASIDGTVLFIPQNVDRPDIGDLRVSMDSSFLINDGQHRRAAIEEALKTNPDLGEETISLVFYIDEGLKRSQQIFTDLNKHAINITRSIGILYDSRDELAVVTKEIIDMIPLLRNFTDKENSSLSKFSPKVFTLSNIYNTNLNVLGGKDTSILDKEKEYLICFWKDLTEGLTEWKQIGEKQLTAHNLRSNYINSHGVVLEALGVIGNYVLKNNIPLGETVKKLNEIDWGRSNPQWVGRSISINGRISKSSQFIKLTVNAIKKNIGIPLNKKELELEGNFQGE